MPEPTAPQPAETEQAEPVVPPETTPPTPEDVPADPTSAPEETVAVTSTDADETSEPAAAAEEQSPPTSPPQATATRADSGPVVRLFDAISENADSTAGQMRQVILIVLGIGFLTTAGFVGATLLSRRGPR